jgi:hypothetical protein
VPHARALIQPNGALLPLLITITAARRSALTAAGQPVPPPVHATLLIDTGATMTNLCTSVIQKLALQPTGSVGILSPTTGTTPHQCATYDVDIIIPAMPSFKHAAALPVVESDFSAQGIHGLIGRDILKEFRMTYSGPDNLVLLSF